MVTQLWVKLNWPSPALTGPLLLRDNLHYYPKLLLPGRSMTPLPVHEIWIQIHTAGTSYILNLCKYSSVSVGDGHPIPVTNTGHNILPTPSKTLRLNNVLITSHIVKNLFSVRQFVHDNDCTIEFDSFSFSVKDFMTCRVLLRCDSTGDLYPVTAPSLILHAFLISQHMWHQRLEHPGSEVLRHLVSNNVISCNKEKPLVLCHVCQLGKHVRLPFVSSSTIFTSCFDIVHSDVWTSVETKQSLSLHHGIIKKQR
ncbi:ribonuclease H-like domain-containing protein [Tanacetum coccineum]